MAGEGQIITGSGHPSDPYIITNTGITDALRVQDSPTVDMTLNGNGLQTDPYLLSARATVRLLTDMIDMAPGQTAELGDTIVVQANGTFNLAPPPVVPAGAVNTRGGIQGDGSVGAPIEIKVSGTWGVGPLGGQGSDSTIGAVVYIDSAGQVRAAPPTALSMTWDNITGKPTSFPSSWNTITGKPTSFPTTWSDVSAKPTSFPTTWALVANKPVTSTLDGRNIYVDTNPPPNSFGANGDLWFEY